MKHYLYHKVKSTILQRISVSPSYHLEVVSNLQVKAPLEMLFNFKQVSSYFTVIIGFTYHLFFFIFHVIVIFILFCFLMSSLALCCNSLKYIQFDMPTYDSLFFIKFLDFVFFVIHASYCKIFDKRIFSSILGVRDYNLLLCPK